MNFYRSSFAKRTRSVWGMLLLAAIATLLFSACGGTTTATATPTATAQATATPTPTPTATSTPSATAAVKMVETDKYHFTPDTLTVKVGTMVVWTNTSDAPHTVTSDTPGVFGSTTNITQNQTFSFTFTTAGTFPYHCNIHPYMKATIIVTA